MKRIHVHIFVKELSRNTGFYTHLLGVKPSFQQPNYVQWKLDNPPINLALSENQDKQGIHHLGIELDSTEAFMRFESQLKNADIQAQSQHDTTCCYARSDKIWPEDPQGILWEIFYSHEKSELLSNADNADASENGLQEDWLGNCCRDLSCNCNEEALATCCVN